MRHRLLVMATIGGQLILHTIERLAQTCDIAMPENGPDPCDICLAGFILLRGQIANHRLRCC